MPAWPGIDPNGWHAADGPVLPIMALRPGDAERDVRPDDPFARHLAQWLQAPR